MTLFGRKVTLTFGQPGQLGRRFESPLRMTFDVKMTDTGEPNSAVIELYNPNEDSIGMAREGGAVFRLTAGYQDADRLIFQGDTVRSGVWVQRTGPDRVLHIEALDGGEFYRFGNINGSWSTEANASQVLEEVLRQTQMPRGTVELPVDHRWPQGIVFHGPAHVMLDRIAATQNARWFVRDGVFNMIAKGSHTGEDAPVYSSSVGQRNLIGSPRPKDNGLIEVTVLLDTGMRPGRRFIIDSKSILGPYICREVRFQGDTAGGPFYSIVTGSEAV